MAQFFVTSEERDEVDRQMCEIKRQLRQKKGSPLDPKRVRRALQDILEGSFGKGNIIEVLRAWGYLDTSFEGKETHSLHMRPLTKEQALDEYRNSGGKTWVWDELEKNMPYAVPKAETLDVMIMNFGKNIGSDESLAEMNKLGVRPLTYEELIQYGIAHPSHQEQKWLVGLGTKHTLVGSPHAPGLGCGGGERVLNAFGWGGDWGDGFRFPVVRKEKPGDYNYLLDS